MRVKHRLPVRRNFNCFYRFLADASYPLDELDAGAFPDWLDQNKLSGFKFLFNPSAESPDANFPYTNMFVRVEDHNAIALEKGPITTLLNFLLLGESDPLRELWDCLSFVRDFVLTHQAFMKQENLFKFLSLMCGSTGASTETILKTKDIVSALILYRRSDLFADSSLPK